MKAAKVERLPWGARSPAATNRHYKQIKTYNYDNKKIQHG